jgi:hypothetical protein
MAENKDLYPSFVMELIGHETCEACEAYIV